MSIIINPNVDYPNNPNRITPHFLKAIPIPAPKENVKKQLAINKKSVGTPKKWDKKLHCHTCGCKRLMKIATMVLDPDGKSLPVYFNLRKLQKAIAAGVPGIPGNFVGFCYVCLDLTPFKVSNGKLVADDPKTLDNLRSKVINERTDPSNREVPSE